MNLKDYFDDAKGVGILSTADSDGKVNAAVYARPHFMNDGEVAFIMRDRLSHYNLQSNPNATYLFKEDNPPYKGKRLYLEKVREEKNSELIDSLGRRKNSYERKGDRFLVYFKLNKVLPLVGDGN